jgi:hypothetical protein
LAARPLLHLGGCVDDLHRAHANHRHA